MSTSTGHCSLFVEATASARSASITAGGRFGVHRVRKSFPPGSLSVVSVPGAVEPPFEWQLGQMDIGNLGGTVTGLDSTTGAVSLNCSGPNPGDPTPNGGMKIGCDFGVLSSDGWAVVDDSSRGRLDPATEWLASSAAENYTDLYFFGFGHRYKAALRAYAAIAGSPKMPPRFALGVWWSR